MHYLMFQTLVQLLATEEQYKKWGPLSESMRILGCYAQTELGHGSDIAGLETTATFDKEKDEFVIHTPTISATKWWPGDMGRMANHAVVFAQLVIDGNQFGVSPFIVQIREFDTHMPCKGIKCGDMGPKLGYNSKDNGWLQFDHVRIPRDQMLMKYVSVDREGDFGIEGDLRVMYTTMMAVRKQIVLGSSYQLSKGLMIAMRYSCVRRQFKNTAGSKEETLLIDYQTQQQKLFPLLATCYMQSSTGMFIHREYEDMMKQVKDGKFDKLDIMHHLTSGYKSLHTQQALDGLI